MSWAAHGTRNRTNAPTTAASLLQLYDDSAGVRARVLEATPVRLAPDDTLPPPCPLAPVIEPDGVVRPAARDDAGDGRVIRVLEARAVGGNQIVPGTNYV